MPVKNTLVLGASLNPIRFSYKMVKSLLRRSYPVIALGRREGSIDTLEIFTGKPSLQDVDTVLLYLNPDNQKEYYDYLINLAPRRIIFNPGTENPELIALAIENDIEAVIDCGLVMLNSHTF